MFIILDQNPRHASKQTLSRWTKNVLEKAGLGSFTVHSGWAAASTCALLLGLPIDIILKQARWKSKSTFVKHYMKTPLILSEKLKNKHNFSSVWQDCDTEKITNRDDEKICKFFSTNCNNSSSVCSSQMQSSAPSQSTYTCQTSLLWSTSVSIQTASTLRNLVRYNPEILQGPDWTTVTETVQTVPPTLSLSTWDGNAQNMKVQTVRMKTLMVHPPALVIPPRTPHLEQTSQEMSQWMNTKSLERNCNVRKQLLKKPDRNYSSGWQELNAVVANGASQTARGILSTSGLQNLAHLGTERPNAHVGTVVSLSSESAPMKMTSFHQNQKVQVTLSQMRPQEVSQVVTDHAGPRLPREVDTKLQIIEEVIGKDSTIFKSDSSFIPVLLAAKVDSNLDSFLQPKPKTVMLDQWTQVGAADDSMIRLRRKQRQVLTTNLNGNL